MGVISVIFGQGTGRRLCVSFISCQPSCVGHYQTSSGGIHGQPADLGCYPLFYDLSTDVGTSLQLPNTSQTPTKMAADDRLLLTGGASFLPNEPFILNKFQNLNLQIKTSFLRPGYTPTLGDMFGSV